MLKEKGPVTETEADRDIDIPKIKYYVDKVLKDRGLAGTLFVYPEKLGTITVYEDMSHAPTVDLHMRGNYLDGTQKYMTEKEESFCFTINIEEWSESSGKEGFMMCFAEDIVKSIYNYYTNIILI